MVLQKKFQSQPSAIASYSYTDIAEGTGNQLFYLCQTEDNSGVDQILTTQTPYSSVIEEAYGIQATDNFGADKVDLDFDLTAFNMPKVVGGTALINAGIYINGQTAEKAWSYVKFTLRHVSDGVETAIGTAQSETYFKDADSGEQFTICMPMVVTEKKFKAGDILRLNVAVRASGSGSGSVGDIVFGTDPVNRDGSLITPSSEDSITSSRITIPFRLLEL